jgi:hypothetical protein
LAVLSRIDRESDDPERVARALGACSVMFSPGFTSDDLRFTSLFAATADAQLRVATLIADHEATTGAGQARRLAEIARVTIQEVVELTGGYRSSSTWAAVEREDLFAKLDTASTTASESAGEDLTRRAARNEQSETGQLHTHIERALSHAATARFAYRARQIDEAVENMGIAVAAYREVVPHSPWHERELARALFDYARYLESRGKRGAALNAMNEAGLLYKQVYKNSNNDSHFAMRAALCAEESHRLRLVKWYLLPRRIYVPPRTIAINRG